MPGKKQKGDIGRQVHMPVSRAFLISLKNIQMRLGRSVVTASGVFLGIAFLVSVLAQGLVEWPLPPKDIQPGYARLDGEFEGPGDYEIWNPVTVKEASAAGVPDDVIARISGGKDMLSLSKLAEAMNTIKSTDSRLKRARIHVSAYDRILKSIANKKDSEFITARMLRTNGLPEMEIDRIAKGGTVVVSDAKTASDAAVSSVSMLERRQQEYSIFRSVPAKAIESLGRDKAKTLADVLQMSADRMKTNNALTKAAHKSHVLLTNKEGRRIAVDLSDMRSAGKIKMVSGDIVLATDAAGANRQLWLVIMSLLVCTIGITNAMLMAVTERFREIGTMKCLGALNKFVVEMFLFESAMLGGLASAAGAIVGLLGTLILAVIGKGFGIITQIAILDVLKLFGIGIAAGCLVTVIATIAPAIRAAKMPPAAALRTEV
ncbi:MAG: FtsX-like permease family protein [Armatimonadota bacterium]